MVTIDRTIVGSAEVRYSAFFLILLPENPQFVPTSLTTDPRFSRFQLHLVGIIPRATPPP